MVANLTQSRPSLHTIALADQLRFLCSVVTKIARADLESRLSSHGAEISAIEHGVLRHLSHGVSSMAEISRLMGVAPSTLVYVVDGLVKKKLVKRSKDPNDRRREPLLLEKKGADLFARAPKMDANSALVAALDGMTDSHRRKLLTLLSEFVENLPGSDRLYLRTEPPNTKPSLSGSQRRQTTPATKARK